MSGRYSAPQPFTTDHDVRGFSCGDPVLARFDFEPSPTDPLHMTLLLKDARALLRRTGRG